MMIHQDAFAWDDLEWGHFREDFFLPVEIPTIPHTPWVLCNIPIPPGIYNKVCTLLKRKIDAGIFEPSNLSYGSRWFCVIKKDGKSLWIVQSLEPLNKVTIQHSGVPLFTDQLAEHFAGRACGSMMDLYVGYDEQVLVPSSHDYTTFQTPYRAMRLTTLPMGWTNSVPIFHEDVTKILQPEILHVTQPYIDDIPVRTHIKIHQGGWWGWNYSQKPRHPAIHLGTRGLYHAPVIPAGIQSFLRNPVESFLAGSPAKIAIPGTSYSGGIEPFRNWDQNGPGMDWNGIRQNAIK